MKYKKCPLDELKAQDYGIFDAFACCASFDRRCLSVPLSLSPRMFKKSFVFAKGDVAGSSEANVKILCHALGDVEPTRISRLDPLKTADAFDRFISETKSGNRLVRLAIDITTFSHESLLILMVLLRHRYERAVDLTLFYMRAGEYDPGTPIEQKWLSRGVREVRSVLGYAGEALPGRKYHLIILPGIEFERAEGLVRQFEPSRVSIGWADATEPETEPHLEVHEHHCRRIQELVGAVEKFKFKAYDIVAAKNVLIDQIDKFSEENAVLSPMNTKVSTLGAALAVKDRPFVQLCYVVPILYNVGAYAAPGNEAIIINGLQDEW